MNYAVTNLVLVFLNKAGSFVGIRRDLKPHIQQNEGSQYLQANFE
jgi:hypothetical protein